MKKSASLLIILAIVFNSCGHIYFFLYFQKKIRKEIKRTILSKIDNKKLDKICVDNDKLNEIISFVHDREFWYKGQLYDIVRTEHNDSQKVYFCINDMDETELVQNYARFFNESNDCPSNTLKSKLIRILKHINFEVFRNIDNITINLPFFKIIKRIKTSKYYSFIIEIQSPPPKY